MKVLVTGAAGFIGRHTIDVLVDKGYEVIALDKDVDGVMSLAGSVRRLGCDITHDIQLRWAFMEAMPDAVIHLAAQSCVATSMRDWVEDVKQNIIGTINVIQACQKYGVQKIVFASSGGAIYGNLTRLPAIEEMPPDPISAYGISKLAGEHYIRISGLDYVILRYPNVYGPGQPSDGESGVVAIFIDRIARGLKPQIFGDGSKARDYVFVADVARANLQALTHGENGIYNIGSGHPISDQQLFEAIAAQMGWDGGCEYLPDRSGDVQRIYLNPFLGSVGLSWWRKIDLIDGIKRTLEASYALQRA